MSVGSLRLLRTAGFSRLDNRVLCQQSSARLIPPVLQSMSRLVLVLWTQSRRSCFAMRCASLRGEKCPWAIEAEECMLPSDGFVLMDDQAGLCATQSLRNPRPKQGFPNGARVCQKRGEGHGRPVERKRCRGLESAEGSFQCSTLHLRRAMLGLPRWLLSRLQQGRCLGAVQTGALGLHGGSDWFGTLWDQILCRDKS